jgi:hypothetical protein
VLQPLELGKLVLDPQRRLRSSSRLSTRRMLAVVWSASALNGGTGRSWRSK